MTKLAILMSLAAALALYAGDISTADAAPFYRTWPGLSCQAGYNEGAVSYSDNNGFSNDDAGWYRTALCPLVTDSNEYFASNTGIGVQLIDQSYSYDASCRMMETLVWAQSVNRAPTITWGPATSSVGSSPVPQWLTVQKIGLSGRGSIRSVLCYVPPTYQGNKSTVLGYDAYLNRQ